MEHQSLSDSVSWLILSTQQQDGSFKENSSFKPNKVMVSNTLFLPILLFGGKILRLQSDIFVFWLQAEGTNAVEQSVYLTSFVLIALCRATSIKDPILQLRVRTNFILFCIPTLYSPLPPPAAVQPVFSISKLSCKYLVQSPHCWFNPLLSLGAKICCTTH